MIRVPERLAGTCPERGQREGDACDEGAENGEPTEKPARLSPGESSRAQQKDEDRGEKRRARVQRRVGRDAPQDRRKAEPARCERELQPSARNGRERPSCGREPGHGRNCQVKTRSHLGGHSTVECHRGCQQSEQGAREPAVANHAGPPPELAGGASLAASRP